MQAAIRPVTTESVHEFFALQGSHGQHPGSCTTSRAALRRAVRPLAAGEATEQIVAPPSVGARSLRGELLFRTSVGAAMPSHASLPSACPRATGLCLTRHCSGPASPAAEFQR